MQVANLVLFDQVKELESINVDFKRHIERRNLGIQGFQNGQNPLLMQKKSNLTHY